MLYSVVYSTEMLQDSMCVFMQDQLSEERKELESQREKYQQDLERLRESTRAVEKEKERLEHQKKIKRKTIEVGISGRVKTLSGVKNTHSKSLVLLKHVSNPHELVKGSASGPAASQVFVSVHLNHLPNISIRH